MVSRRALARVDRDMVVVGPEYDTRAGGICVHEAGEVLRHGVVATRSRFAGPVCVLREEPRVVQLLLILGGRTQPDQLAFIKDEKAKKLEMPGTRSADPLPRLRLRGGVV
jgi:hypothetical protein